MVPTSRPGGQGKETGFDKARQHIDLAIRRYERLKQQIKDDNSEIDLDMRDVFILVMGSAKDAVEKRVGYGKKSGRMVCG